MEWKQASEVRTWIAPGVELSQQVIESGSLKETIQQLRINTSQPQIHWYPVSSRGKVERLETVRELMKDANCARRQIIAAVNGDFFSYTGVPSGLQIVNGEIITSPSKTKVLMVRWPDGRTALKEEVHFRGMLQDSAGHTLALDAVNRSRSKAEGGAAVLYNERFGESTRTLEGGLEILLECEQGARFMTGKQSVRVVTSEKTANSKIPHNYAVLSLSGEKAACAESWLKPGEEYTLALDYDQEVGLAHQVISGNSTLAYVLIRDKEVAPSILNPDVEHNHHRHPRTIAAVRGEELFLFVIDGRQPGYSDGMTMAESAYYLQSLNMDFAINLDGGGSTTCFARLPGSLEPTLLNSPSDGMERAVGNSIVVANEAPVGKLSQLLLSADPPFNGSWGRTEIVDYSTPVSILAGSTIAFTVKAVDEHLHPVELTEEQVEWSASPSLGQINAQGELIAVSHRASGQITCQVQGMWTALSVHIHDEVGHLSVKPKQAVVDPRGSVEFAVRAYDRQGQELLCSPEALVWTAESGVGSVTAKGCFHATTANGTGSVRIAYKEATTTALVQLGEPPRLIADFEQIDNIAVSSEGVVPDSVQFQKVARPQPVRFGTFAGKLTYDFRNYAGLSRASIHFVNEAGEYGTVVEGKPLRIALWVYGDGQGHWLRLGIQDRHGHPVSVEFTEKGGLDWHDWKYVTAELPKHLAYPISITHISLVEYNDANKNQGAIYFDHMRAEYIDHQEDVTGPAFSDYAPAPGELVAGIEDAPLVVSAVVTDEQSGVDPASVSMWINARRVNPEFDPQTGRVSWREQPDRDSVSATYEVKLCAKDRNGNPSVPAGEWSFQVK